MIAIVAYLLVVNTFEINCNLLIKWRLFIIHHILTIDQPKIISNKPLGNNMPDFSSEEKIILVQYGIKKYENEETIIEKLKTILSEKDVQRNIDTLIGTQRVRRIGSEILQNNESHTELPELPENLKDVIRNL